MIYTKSSSEIFTICMPSNHIVLFCFSITVVSGLTCTHLDHLLPPINTQRVTLSTKAWTTIKSNLVLTKSIFLHNKSYKALQIQKRHGYTRIHYINFSFLDNSLTTKNIQLKTQNTTNESNKDRNLQSIKREIIYSSFLYPLTLTTPYLHVCMSFKQSIYF